MKEQVTNFDFEAAFKALDTLDYPEAKNKRQLNKLTESVKAFNTGDALLEELYNVSDKQDLEKASEDREKDVALAKLARIEKIVDLDADTAEDLLGSYVGKNIIQCPQCKTLFYKNAEDIVASDSDPKIVNVDEVCQHCGNTSGYELIGKVAEEELPQEEPVAETAPDENNAEVSEEETDNELNLDFDLDVEETVNADELDTADSTEVDLEKVDTEDTVEDAEETTTDSDDEDEKDKEVSESLKEDLDGDMEQYNYYIAYLKNMLAQDEEALEKAKKMKDNEFAIAAIEKRIAADKEDLDAALPKIVKDKADAETLPTPEEIEQKDTESGEKTEKSADELGEALKADINTPEAELTKIIDDPDKTDAEKAELIYESGKAANKMKHFVDSLKEGTEQDYFDDLTVSTVADEIQDYLGGSVTKHLKNASGHPVFRFGKYNFEDIYADENVIRVYTESEDKLDDAKQIATEFGREFEVKQDKHIHGPKKTYLEIKLQPTDWDEVDRDSIAHTETSKLDNKNEAVVDFAEIDDLDEGALNSKLTEYFKNVYKNVDSFMTENCRLENNKLFVEGSINFKSGKVRNTLFEFNYKKTLNSGSLVLEGLNKDFSQETAFMLKAKVVDKNLITEGLKYRYKVNESLVKGEIK